MNQYSLTLNKTMPHSQFSLSWSAHRTNICSGLSALQQNSEFVDMTLAADGHHVKVHQLVMALASPYIKDLISTAQCPHPVIFLNKVSYSTLSLILEYIYTGEVVVPIDNLSELAEAGRELSIKGLEDMNLDYTEKSKVKPERDISYTKKGDSSIKTINTNEEEKLNDDDYYFEVTCKSGEEYVYKEAHSDIQASKQTEDEILNEETYDKSMLILEDVQTDDASQDVMSQDIVCEDISPSHYSIEKVPKIASVISKKSNSSGMMQYTVSNQGSIQLIMNRFVYYLKHTKRSGTRQWRCVDYLTPSRCPAIVVTNDEVVLQRISAHTHPFHDKRILKKVNGGAVFAALSDAIHQGQTKKNSMDTDANTSV